MSTLIELNGVSLMKKTVKNIQKMVKYNNDKPYLISVLLDNSVELKYGFSTIKERDENFNKFNKIIYPPPKKLPKLTKNPYGMF
jgi:hypothetical protein